MIKIDRDGLTLCKLQGELFENSIKYVNQSSSIFIRRFMNSNIARTFDSKDILNDTKPFEMIYEILDDEFGKSEYGSKKFGSESLFWIGYIYRYFSYTYNLSSKQVYKMIKPDELNERYYVYHTFDPVFAIERILEEKNISLDEKSQNKRMLNLIRNQKYNEDVKLIPMTRELAHKLFVDFKNDVSMFENKEFFKEYFYDKKNIDLYVDTKKEKGYVLLAITYKDEVIGEIRFKNISNESAELGIVLKNDECKNKGLGSYSLSKSLDYAKEVLRLKKILVSILPNNTRLIHVFEKIGFKEIKEDNNFIWFEKII